MHWTSGPLVPGPPAEEDLSPLAICNPALPSKGTPVICEQPCQAVSLLSPWPWRNPVCLCATSFSVGAGTWGEQGTPEATQQAQLEFVGLWREAAGRHVCDSPIYCVFKNQGMALCVQEDIMVYGS